MENKECFDYFILNQKCKNSSDFTKAKIYYNEASDKEKKDFDIICSTLGRALYNFYLDESFAKIKAFFRMHNLDAKEIHYLIGKYTPKETEIINILDYWAISGENIPAKLNTIFQECLQTGWKKPELEKIAAKYRINYDMLMGTLNEYLTEHNPNYPISMEEIFYEIRCSEEFNRFVASARNSTNEALWYYENKANEVEKAQYNEAMATINAKIELQIKNTSTSKEESQINQILSSKYYKFAMLLLSNHSLEEQAIFAKNNSIRLHYFISDYLPLFLNVYAKSHSAEEVAKIEEHIRTSYNTYLKYCQDKESKYYIFSMMLINSASLVKLIEFITSNDVNLSYYKNKYLPNFINKLPQYQGDTSKQSINTLNTNLQAFIEGKSPTPSKIDYDLTQEQILKLKYRFTVFVHGNTYKSHAQSKKIYTITPEEIEMMSKIDPTLHELYACRFGRKLFMDLRDVERLLIYLQNGILDNGVMRPFDIIDYYLIFKKPIDCILKAFNGLSAPMCALLTTFYKDNKVLIVKPEELLTLNTEINCQKDAQGYPIPGTGVQATMEEKEQIINYLILNNIPLTPNVYHIAQKRYFAGTLNINNPEPART